MAAVEIRRLTPELLDEALAIYGMVLGKITDADRRYITERMASGTGIFCAAVDSETQRVVGIKFANIHGEVCVGRGIAVLPEYRRQGIATRLLERFRAELATHAEVRLYTFGSGTTEGIPFHIASGYVPRALIQFQDKALRERLDLDGLRISQEGFNETYKVYQIYLELGEVDRNLAGLR